MSREDYDMAIGISTVAIVGAYPDFPNNVLGESIGNKALADFQHQRAQIAAEVVFQCLTTVDFTMSRR
jgi:hypothetical protein